MSTPVYLHSRHWTRCHSQLHHQQLQTVGGELHGWGYSWNAMGGKEGLGCDIGGAKELG